MKKIICSVFLSVVLNGLANAQFDSKYSAFTIPDSLRKNADAVVREDMMHLKVKSADNAVLEVHSIVTILNESASEYLGFTEFSDKFRVLDDAEIKVYNAVGKELNKYSKREMQNFGYGDGLVEDGKITYFKVTAATYPITVEQKYTVKYKGILDYPDSYILSPDVSKEHFSFVVEVPSEMGLRYKVLNTSAAPLKEQKDNNTVYSWELKNLMAMKREASSGPTERYFPRIILSPNKFKIGGFEGDMSSWKSFGKWFYDLIDTDNTLSEKGQAFIRDLVKNATTDAEKEKIIYAYLQRNMRYVSVQLGIGGWKPFKADFVQEKKYGDCKALSNYMQAALKAVGIKSYYAIVNARQNAMPAMEDFPSSPFNHVILCIPHQPDSTWLECTSNTSDFGTLGDFTENRKALLVTENGGILVSTPKSKAASNKFYCNTFIKLNEDGTGVLSATLSGTGEFRQEQLHYLDQRSNDEQARYLIKTLGWKHPDEIKFTMGDKTKIPYITGVNMRYEQVYAFKAGSKMFIQPRFYSLFDETVNDNDKRKQDYFFEYPYIKSDSTVFELPEGYGVETLPKDKSISNSFATYSCKYSWNETTRRLSIYATLEIIQHLIKAVDYQKLMQFKREADTDLNQRLVIKKS